MRRPALLLALLGTLAIAACGGDDQLSAKEYRAQARTICSDADKATAAVKEPTRATPDAIVDYFERLLKANEATTKRFQSLEPPDGLSEAHEDAMKANRDGVAEVKRVISELADGGDPREVLTGAQSRLQRLSRQAASAAERLGVPECADQ